MPYFAQGITGSDSRRSAPVLDMGVHAIDAATSLLGPAHSVISLEFQLNEMRSASLRSPPVACSCNIIQGESCLQVELLRPIGPRGDAALLLHMRCGAAVTIECSWDR